jgi:phospholipase/lecithinase/hemolysin
VKEITEKAKTYLLYAVVTWKDTRFVKGVAKEDIIDLVRKLLNEGARWIFIYETPKGACTP